MKITEQNVEQFRIYCLRLLGINRRFEEVRKRHEDRFSSRHACAQWDLAAMVGFRWAVGAIPDFFMVEDRP